MIRLAAQRAIARQGSLSARALGSVVHAYIDKLAQEFAAGAAVEENTLDGWLPGIAAMLRAKGLAPTEIKPRAAQTLAALRSALADPLGRWLLAPHPQAASELPSAHGRRRRTRHLPHGSRLSRR